MPVTQNRFTRFVALGDSTTEGLDDPYPGRQTYRGWADRLAERLAALNPDFAYANLAIRGRLSWQIREQQMEPALAMRPDLVSMIGGLNDVLRRRFDLDFVIGQMEEMVVAFRNAGATVITATYPDPSAVMRVTGIVRDRVVGFNAAIREMSVRHDTVLLDMERDGLADPRFWSEDRLHANAEGHDRIAAAVAELLELPDADHSWAEPLPPLETKPRVRAVTEEVVWAAKFFGPWIWRRLRGRSSGDGISPKRPQLTKMLGPESGRPAAR